MIDYKCCPNCKEYSLMVSIDDISRCDRCGYTNADDTKITNFNQKIARFHELIKLFSIEYDEYIEGKVKTIKSYFEYARIDIGSATYNVVKKSLQMLGVIKPNEGKCFVLICKILSRLRNEKINIDNNTKTKLIELFKLYLHSRRSEESDSINYNYTLGCLYWYVTGSRILMSSYIMKNIDPNLETWLSDLGIRDNLRLPMPLSVKAYAYENVILESI
jgi:hypothetical protein